MTGMQEYLKQVWEVENISQITPVEIECILMNTEDRSEYPNGYPLDTEVWAAYAKLHGLPEGMTHDEYVKCHHYLSYCRSLHEVGEMNTGTPNLDALGRGDLENVAQVFKQLAAYAKLKMRAISDRKQGEIEDALCQERDCEAIYNSLPEWAKW